MNYIREILNRLSNITTIISKLDRDKWNSTIIWITLFIFLYIIGMYIPEGFDWIHYFSKGRLHPIWTPWTTVIIEIFNWQLIVSITLFTLIYRTYKYNRSPFPAMLAILSLPTIWVLFMGNLDGLVLLGLIIGPFGVPLTLMKPQLSAFAVLATKKSFLAATIWGVFSLTIWGLWPLKLSMVLTTEWRAEWIQDISLFPWGLIIALPLMFFSMGDEELLMAAGSFATPHLFPYHFIVLMPALGRMNWPWMIITWIISWTPLLANWLGNKAWHFGNLMSLCFWLGIYLNKELSPSNQGRETSVVIKT